MKVEATLNNLRISPRKVRLVTNLIKGMDANNALVQLSHAIKGSSRPVEKLLRSALANAENNFGLDKDNMFVSDVQVGEGPILKRWLPRAQGRATQLLKRTSNIYMTLDERIEGMGKKKAQVKKDVKKEEAVEEPKAEAKDEKKAVAPKAKMEKKASAKGAKGGFSKKVFQRKSA
ncbi:MAG: 50S ribosomal protein L22 [Candidatus Moranbacteria bacterium GW2011_GWE1_49_15]|nr:MAG: 50S ribosomal protein L22 [Candidatus Moranbacteria bacterium GW2011_GWE2_47_10]KKW07446.1 MAG: 50S ribosomal protein L22 [Candidatus Moranbacteria bacterium GW2011_GWE1_49_15]HBP01466.1 50S ribosomal protein L22 [Candidatus Moranbacteria bacterium]